MKSRMLLSLAMATMSLVMATGCSTSESKKKSDEALKAQAEAQAIGSRYTTVVFQEGESDLTQLNKEDIKKLAALAHKDVRPIEKIKILAWSDKEYPEKVHGKTSAKDIILASERARVIKEYLSEDLKELENIDTFNMARRPGALGKIFKTEDYEVKEVVENSGTTGSKLPDGSVSYTKASKAFVIIDYKEEL